MASKIPQTPANYERTRIVERPDGFYWQSIDSGREYGPFATLVEAVDDMEFADGATAEPTEPLFEAEDEIGIADWVDPDTGEPAECGVPHIEDR